MRIFAAIFLLGAVLLPAHAFKRTAPAPLGHTFESPEALARGVVEALSRRDLTALRDLALSQREFRELVWPELPVSRPERNMPLDYVWRDLETKSRGYLLGTLRRPLPVGAQLVRVEFDGETTRYSSFTVHRKSRLVVRDAGGAESALRLFGSVLERNGRYKIFSFVTD